MKIKRVDDYFMRMFQSKLGRVHHLLHWSSLWPSLFDWITHNLSFGVYAQQKIFSSFEVGHL